MQTLTPRPCTFVSNSGTLMEALSLWLQQAFTPDYELVFKKQIPSQRSVVNHEEGRRQALVLEIVTGIRLWKVEGIDVARLLFFFFFFFLVGSFIGSDFNFITFSTLTLTLYFLFFPQADMDSLEGNDIPKSSHKPSHESHNLHTHR